MAKMTKVQCARHDRLLKARDKATAAVYAAAPNNVTPFLECLAMASYPVKENYKLTQAFLDTFELGMIQEGRAYRGIYGMFTKY